MEKKTVLYVGCGADHVLGKRGFDADHWREVRLDIDPDCAPDLVGTMTDLSAVDDESVDAVYSSHTLEHLLPQEAPAALKEVRRVLRPDGVLVLTCPNIQEACRLMAEGKWQEKCYPIAEGRYHITPPDLLYGAWMTRSTGKPFMSHQYGYIPSSLAAVLRTGGFASVGVVGNKWTLYAVAAKQQLDDAALKALFMHHWGGGATVSHKTDAPASAIPQAPETVASSNAEQSRHAVSLLRPAPEECSPEMSLQGRYLYTLKQSLLNNFYVENDARLLYLAQCMALQQPVDQRKLVDPRRSMPDMLAHIERCKAVGAEWYVLQVKKDDGTTATVNLRNQVDFAYSMIGKARMDNLEFCLDCIRQENIPGDLMETGVCRGGAVIFMQGYLKAWDMRGRTVWAADSFEGLPRPELAQDAGWDFNKEIFPVLAIDEERVKATFARYGLLDDNVVFLKGWFCDTLPAAPVERLALLRLDGDLYASTMDALRACYHKVVPGGFVIVDDWALEPCRKAVEDFRREQGVTEELIPIDPASVYWRKDR
ncbi:class I SAM-dependent methyltransferase [uncultured Desulfovibrio sp.]|uniref:class I SAM-dependent methyltransferase n=1 Tax=uncultured Desulfovibrio sp. TaxID=167968 RepID=UPI002623A3B4|nr:class I SAM-dependent methyltransferase [uncultured Desulfovibrio sp.]